MLFLLPGGSSGAIVVMQRFKMSTSSSDERTKPRPTDPSLFASNWLWHNIKGGPSTDKYIVGKVRSIVKSTNACQLPDRLFLRF